MYAQSLPPFSVKWTLIHLMKNLGKSWRRPISWFRRISEHFDRLNLTPKYHVLIQYRSQIIWTKQMNLSNVFSTISYYIALLAVIQYATCIKWLHNSHAHHCLANVYIYANDSWLLLCPFCKFKSFHHSRHRFEDSLVNTVHKYRSPQRSITVINRIFVCRWSIIQWIYAMNMIADMQ